MAEVVLVHFVLGLRPGVIAAAERLRAAGHTVYTPDYFDGEVFDNLDDGSRKEQALGYREIARRTSEAVAGLPTGLVFSGFSLGPCTPNCRPPRDPAPWGPCSRTAPSPSKGLGSLRRRALARRGAGAGPLRR
jgi:hypothetical protein